MIRFLPALFIFLSGASSHLSIPLFRPGSVHNGSVSGDDSDHVFPDELNVSSFSSVIGSHSMLGKHSQPTLTLPGPGHMCVLGVTCHLHFWQNDLGLLCATVVTRGGTDIE